MTSHVSSSENNEFTFTQLKYDGKWDPYPGAWYEIRSFLSATTSVLSSEERTLVSLSDESLFESPFLFMSGEDEFPSWSAVYRDNLRNFIRAGGLMVIDDAGGGLSFGFEKSIKRELKAIFPEYELESISDQHAVFKSYYIIRDTGGRRLTKKYLECIEIDGRIAVIYSSNDLLGVWPRDKLGNWLNRCVPDGEPQRLNGMKMMLNIIVYALTGTYKSDPIHRPFIEQKMSR